MMPSQSKQNNDERKGPSSRPLIIAWASVYDAIPGLRVPGTNLDIAFTLLSAAFLMTMRFVNLRYLCLGLLQLDEHASTEVSGSMGSILHSTILCPALLVALLTVKEYNPSQHRDKESQWWVNFIDAQLQFCTGYMVQDSLFILLFRFEGMDLASGVIPTSLHFSFTDDDILFLCHHLLTTIYMTQCRVYRAGHMSAMICMFLGELSNPLHNAYWISDILMGIQGRGNATVHFILETSFAIVYNAIRVVIAPVFFAHVSYNLMFSKDGNAGHLPFLVRVFWVVMIWAVEYGSISTITMCHSALKKNLFGDGVAEQDL